MRTSLYADDAAIFIAPIKRDIDNLAGILMSFCEVTGLCTNFHKSLVAPIRCNHINLENTLQNFPTTMTTFHIRYLGLPLSVWTLKKVDFQYLLDKVGASLPLGRAKALPLWVGRSLSSSCLLPKRCTLSHPSWFRRVFFKIPTSLRGPSFGPEWIR